MRGRGGEEWKKRVGMEKVEDRGLFMSFLSHVYCLMKHKDKKYS